MAGDLNASDSVRLLASHLKEFAVLFFVYGLLAKLAEQEKEHYRELVRSWYRYLAE